MRTRSVVLAAILAGLLAIALVMSRQPACETGGHAKGDVRREANGRLLYFDGHCWTSKPLPAQDSPF